MLPATPVWLRSTVDMISEVLGDWNIAIPTDIVMDPIRNTTSEVLTPNVDKISSATVITHKPIKQRNSEPILSDSCPLNGARIPMVTE